MSEKRRQEPREKAEAFLKRHGMHFERIDMAAEIERLMAAMEKDRRIGVKSGRMIPTYIGDYRRPAKEKTVTVLDIGGTNVRSAVITLDAAGIKSICGLKSFLTPGVSAPEDTAGFFGKIVEGVKEDLVSDEIGICFSLATVPQKDRDAVMVAGGKQIMITDMMGKRVGESFRQAMAVRGLESGQRITVINDTVAAALGGCSVSGEDAFGGFIGFIYGTGINLCFREQTGEWINTEAGAYCTMPTGDMDDDLDAGLIDPGGDRLEKMVSGGYQGGLMTCILRTAAAEGVIESATWADLFPAGGKEVLSSKDISAFANDSHGDNRIAAACANETDREVLLAVCDAMTERSARISTVVLTAGLLRSGAGFDPEKPVFITAEGSTYLKQKDFKEKLERNMEAFAVLRHGLHYEFHTVPDVILRGTAAACMSG